MGWRRLWLVGGMTLVLSGVLLASAGIGAGAGAAFSTYSVSVNSYTIGSVATSPSTAHVGDRVTFSGTGYLPKTYLEAGIIGRTDTDIYSAFMASVTSDDSGNWTAQVTVPSTVIRDSDKAAVPMLYGNWTVLGVGTGSDGGVYGSTGTLSIVASTSSGTGSNGSTGTGDVQSAMLPNTGVPAAAPWLTGLGLLMVAFLGIERWYRRSGSKTV